MDILPSPLLRQLTHTLYEKRKLAALEVERIVKDNCLHIDKINHIVTCIVSTLSYSNNVNARNGGLIALAAVAIALDSNLHLHLSQLLPPVLVSLSHIDSKVRYYACESLYNIVKIAHFHSLIYFNEIFDALAKLSTDADTSVRSGAELLDRLLKDIVCDQASYFPPELIQSTNPLASLSNSVLQPSSVPDTLQIGSITITNSAQSTTLDPISAPLIHSNTSIIVPGTCPLLPNTSPKSFNLARFIPLLSERIHVVSSSSRMFFVQWIALLSSVPDLELLSYLPSFLDGLFCYLSDPNDDVRVATLNVLQSFLKEIRQVYDIQSSTFPFSPVSGSLINESSLSILPSEVAATDLNTLNISEIIDKQSIDQIEVEKQQILQEIVIPLQEPRDSSIPYIPGQGIRLDFGKMTEILLLHLNSQDQQTQEHALYWTNEFITLAKHIILPFSNTIIDSILSCLAHSVPSIKQIATETNSNLFHLIATTEESLFNTSLFDLTTTIDAITLKFQDENESTRIASVEWLIMLHRKSPNSISINDQIFSILLANLTDASELVVKKNLQLLAQISNSSSDDSLVRFLERLVELFSIDRRLLDSRIGLIVRTICFNIDAERCFRCFSDVLYDLEDLEFSSIVIQNLNTILMTAPELVETRRRLKLMDKEGVSLFLVLFKSWCHNPVSTFTLTLLTGQYEQASNLLQIFGTEIEVSVGFLVQVDKLVQMLESPVFTYLRLQTIDPNVNPYLLKCLYGILALLPQSSAFAMLRNRLNSASNILTLYSAAGLTPQKRELPKKTPTDSIKWNDLLSGFRSLQIKHENQRNEGINVGKRHVGKKNQEEDEKKKDSTKSTRPSSGISSINKVVAAAKKPLVSRK